jgi:hypothetical protein
MIPKRLIRREVNIIKLFLDAEATISRRTVEKPPFYPIYRF